MADSVSVQVDVAGLLAAWSRVADAAGARCLEAAYESAVAIQREASNRLSRQLGAYSTGKTLAGLQVEPMDGRRGYRVTATREPFPNLPLWIEKGTKKGKPGSHTQPARPFLEVSARLEEGAHLRRIIDAVQSAIDETGLGA